jgi:hypothetical protein
MMSAQRRDRHYCCEQKKRDGFIHASAMHGIATAAVRVKQDISRQPGEITAKIESPSELDGLPLQTPAIEYGRMHLPPPQTRCCCSKPLFLVQSSRSAAEILGIMQR